MSNNVPSYKWNQFYWTNIFTKEEIAYINKHIERNFGGYESTEKGAKDGDGNLIKKVSTVKYIRYDKIESLLSGLVKHAYQVANMDFGYTTFGPLAGQNLLHNTYESDSKDNYGWHVDNTSNATNDVKLTLIFNLSTEPYEGGEFQTWPSDYINRNSNKFNNPGTAIMFKSHILHRVTPVTSGTRKSLTMFIHGPRFQ